MSVRTVKQITQGDPAEQDLNLISLGTGSVLLPQYRSPSTPRLQNSGSHSIVQDPQSPQPLGSVRNAHSQAPPHIFAIRNPGTGSPEILVGSKPLGVIPAHIQAWESSAHGPPPPPPHPPHISSQLGSSPMLSTLQGAVLGPRVSKAELTPCRLPGMPWNLCVSSAFRFDTTLAPSKQESCLTPCCVSLSKFLEFSGPQFSGLTTHSNAGISLEKLWVNWPECTVHPASSFTVTGRAGGFGLIGEKAEAQKSVTLPRSHRPRKWWHQVGKQGIEAAGCRGEGRGRGRCNLCPDSQS